jgi:hypothetical protein
MRRYLTITIATLGLLLSACSQAAGPPPGAAEVNGAAVPVHLYDVLVKTQQRIAERMGIQVSWGSPAGEKMLLRIRKAALGTAVRDAVIEQMALRRHITVESAEASAAMDRIGQAFGGTAALYEMLDQEGISVRDFEQMYYYRLLESKLRRADPAGYDAALRRAIAQAQVQAFVGPCQSAHSYPSCLSGT